jgi:anti-anti-sigma factor
MKLKRVDESSATVLDIVGRLDGSTADVLRAALDDLIAERPERLVLDLGGMEYVSSAGLRVLLMAAKQVRGTSTTLVLCALRPQVTEVFEISGLSAVFSIVPGRETATTQNV